MIIFFFSSSIVWRRRFSASRIVQCTVASTASTSHVHLWSPKLLNSNVLTGNGVSHLVWLQLLQVSVSFDQDPAFQLLWTDPAPSFICEYGPRFRQIIRLRIPYQTLTHPPQHSHNRGCPVVSGCLINSWNPALQHPLYSVYVVAVFSALQYLLQWPYFQHCNIYCTVVAVFSVKEYLLIRIFNTEQQQLLIVRSSYHLQVNYPWTPLETD